jgi:hypothetical protein
MVRMLTQEYFFKIPGYSIILGYAEQLSKKIFEKKLFIRKIHVKL